MHMALKTGVRPGSRKYRVLIVDDHPVVRYGIARLVNQEQDMEVCGETSSGEEALRLIPTLHPHVVVADISLPAMDGLTLTRLIHNEYPRISIIILSMHDENIYACKAISCGARAYVTKDESSERLITAIREVLNGGLSVNEYVRSLLVQASASRPQAEGESPVQTLSDRERQIFLMIGQGRNSREMAEKLGISPKTVDTYKLRMKIKLGIDSNHKLLLAASQWLEKEKLRPEGCTLV